MSLSAGHKLGPYEILAKLGEGGMGEVYRAKDTRLGREVAVKVSHERFNERFDREARAISSLNHPNICALYDVGPDYLVMEFVDGESPRGPIALDDALAIAMQMADALREAHDKGIVHRDLKPANIKITPDGKVKVLDFGLAKAMDQASGSGLQASAGQLTISPTITSPAMTHAGMILGTAAYMAPEQARGKTVDTRADIWAFGVVLYELLTGARPFKGDDLTETLASVVKDQPDLSGVPLRVRRLLEACLQKDPKKRLQSIGDVGLLLGNEAIAAPVASRGRFGTVAPLAPLVMLGAAAIAVVAALGFAALVYFRPPPPVERAFRLSIPLPVGTSPGFLELSPDGTRLVLQLTREGIPLLYVRSLEADDLQPIAGTTNARSPFWSADSRFIGFFADGRLKIIPAGGGPVRVLCEQAGIGGGGTWSRDGVILFGGPKSEIVRVDAKGGDCTPVRKTDANVFASHPTFVPDGRRFFYAGGNTLDSAADGVYLATLEEPVGRRVLEDPSSVLYTPPAATGGYAHVLFRRQGTLMAQPVDDASLETVGDPFPVVSGTSFSLSPPGLAATVSGDGLLVYVAGRSLERQLTWVDLTGAPLGTVGPKGFQNRMLLSPDGNMVAITRNPPNDAGALWVHDLVRGSELRLTPSGSFANTGVWTPDSSRLLFEMAVDKKAAWYQKDFRSGQQELLAPIDLAGVQMTPTDWSADGRFVIYNAIDPKTKADILYAPVNAGRIDDKAAVKFLATDAVETQGQLSPDGRWLAYTSNESGAYEVHVRAFPTAASEWKVSNGPAQEPRWRADGKELYFTTLLRSGQIAIWGAAVESDGRGGVRTRTPRKMLEARASTAVVLANMWTYSPHPDGKRFLINAATETSDPTVNVITNWQQAASVAR